MKLAYVVGTRDIGAKQILGLSGNLDENLRVLAENGYEGVEFAVRDPKKETLKEVESIVKRYSLEVVAVSTGQVYVEEGLSLLSANATTRKEAWTRLTETVNFAAYFGAMVNIGSFRGRTPEGWTKNEAEKYLVDCFSKAAEYASQRGVKVILEPINRNLVDLINSTAEAISFADKVASKYFGLELDLFHMNIEDTSLTESIKEASHYLWHVHVCDSNRKPPGFGHLPFKRIIRALREVDYSGYLSVEAYQWPDQESALRHSCSVLRPLLELVG